MGLIERLDVVVAEGDVERGGGVGEVGLLRGADDRRADDRVAQNSGQGDLGHRHVMLFRDTLDGVGDRYGHCTR